MGQAHGKRTHAAAQQNGNAVGHDTNTQPQPPPPQSSSSSSSPPLPPSSQETPGKGLSVLTDRQKFLVRQTWDIARNDMERVGFTTFNAVFEKHQDLKQVFVESWGLSEDDVDDERLLSHGLRVVSILNQVVENIDDAAKVDTILSDLGRRHVNYNVTPEMVPIIGIRFLASFQPMLEEESLWTAEIEKTWKLIIDHITNVIVTFLRTGIVARESSHSVKD